MLGRWPTRKVVQIVCNESGNGLNWPLDVRCQWPLRVFEKVCKCNKGWGGYDCSECDFGYIDDGNGGCVPRLINSKNEKEKKWAVNCCW